MSETGWNGAERSIAGMWHGVRLGLLVAGVMAAAGPTAHLGPWFGRITRM